MAYQVDYEWDIEELEEAPSAENGFDPDIADHHFCDSYAEAFDASTGYYHDIPHRVVLVRNVGNEVDGLVDRAWAYITDGKLPETFEYGGGEYSGIPVPKRFHAEVAKVTT